MTTTKKIQEAIREVVQDCSGGIYSPSTVYGYGALAAKVAARIGLKSGVCCGDERANSQTLRRLISLADRHGVDASELARVVSAREERRQFETTFENKYGERLTIRADFRQAACSISAKYDDCDWFVTPFQVADARHSAAKACELVYRWVKRQS